jgi:hypothetical protein
MLYRSQMTDYARMRLAHAHKILTDHADGTGCCPCCGRPAPCDLRTDAERTHKRYAAWLHPQPIFGAAHRFDRAGAIVRPYVENVGH